MTNAIGNRRKSLHSYAIASGAVVALAISAVVAMGSSAPGSTSLAPRREAPVVAVGREASYETIQEYAGREQAVLESLSMPFQPLPSDADVVASVTSTEVANFSER
jgi:hypothetical protein